MDLLFLFLCTLLVLLMQVGFLFLEAGTVRKKNTVNVAAKNLVDLAVVFFLFWLVGYGVMFGASFQGLFGSSRFMISEFMSIEEGAVFLYQAVFCATSVTIISGAIAERGSLKGYITISVLVVVFIYPVVGHWVWSDVGWLAKLGFVDFAGATVVHSVGGWAALASIIIIGPRLNRFVDGHGFNHSSLVQTVAGVVFLWIGWLGFNAGSSQQFDVNTFNIVLNTILAGSAGGLTAVCLSLYLTKQLNIPLFCNGILSGLVAVTASCNIVSIPSSIAIGAIGSLFSITLSYLLRFKKLDDVVDAVPVHLASGIWGTIAVALFAPNDYFLSESVWDARLKLLEVQVIGVVVTGLFVFTFCYLMFSLVAKIIPLRVSEQEELLGLNIATHDASSDLYDLVSTMQEHESSGDFSQRVNYDPTSEIGMIARQYNRVLSRFEEALLKVTQKHSSLLQSNQRLKSMESKVLRSERLSSLGQISSGLVREINEPISYVLSNINTLNEYNSFFKLLVTEYKAYAASISEHPTVAHEVLKRIDKICEEENLDFVFQDSEELLEAASEGADKIKNILSNIRTFSEYGDEKFDLNDVNTVLASAVERVSQQVQANCQLIEAYESGTPMVSCSSLQLEQLFVNVLSNSLQAVGDEKGAIKVTVKHDNKQVTIVFIDNGVGINEEHFPRIFDPFFTTHSATGHSGLGLSICFGIVNNHGGHISAVSKLGKGTKLTIKLPVAIAM